jgi:hypothetical protein
MSLKILSGNCIRLFHGFRIRAKSFSLPSVNLIIIIITNTYIDFTMGQGI